MVPDERPAAEQGPQPHVMKRRGHHKVFLGYAPGVGKTYTMLAEAHRRLTREHQDIVVGFVEPHRRPETIALLEGLEQVPTKKIEYRGKVFEELDTQAVIVRRPEWVLVDELAHTNVPGTRHEKRWQSVEEILAAGLNVISTVNVQHLESLNDIVHEITGVRVRETVPDAFLEDADEIVLVDVTPQALINRLQRGVVYAAEKVPQALKNFFRKGNLTALRELALRAAAEEVDDELREYMDEKAIAEAWRARDRVLVSISARPAAQTLVRRGYRMAERLNALLWILYVRLAGQRLTPEEERWLDEARAVAASVGSAVHEVEGDSVAEEIIRFTVENHVTHIVLGQSARTRVDEILRGSIVNKIMRETSGVDVVVVADPGRAAPP